MAESHNNQRHCEGRPATKYEEALGTRQSSDHEEESGIGHPIRHSSRAASARYDV